MLGYAFIMISSEFVCLKQERGAKGNDKKEHTSFFRVLMKQSNVLL